MSKIDLLISAIIVIGLFSLGDAAKFMINKFKTS